MIALQHLRELAACLGQPGQNRLRVRAGRGDIEKFRVQRAGKNASTLRVTGILQRCKADLQLGLGEQGRRRSRLRGERLSIQHRIVFWIEPEFGCPPKDGLQAGDLARAPAPPPLTQISLASTLP